MLVISRKAWESLIIADNIKVTIVSLGNDKAAIGIEAPKEIKIIREELVETIEANKASIETTISERDYQGLAELLKNKKNSENNS
jgi:carbon storage regulator